MRKSKRSIIILLMAGSLAIQGLTEFIGGYNSLIKPFAMAEAEKETEEETMAKNVIRMAKSGESESYAVKDTVAREAITAEATERSEAISAEASTREQKDAEIRNAIAEEFDSTKAYKNGEYVIYNGITYRFVMDRPAGEWDGGYCIEADITKDIYENQDNEADLFDALKKEFGVYTSFVPYEFADGVYDWSMNLNTGVGGIHLTAKVKENHKYIIAGYRWAKSYPAVLFLNNSTLIGYYNANTGLNERFTDVEVITPANCNNVIINGVTAGYDTGSPMIKEVNLLPSDLVFGAADFTIENGVYNNSYVLNTVVGIHSVYDVNPGDLIRYSSFKYANSYPILLFKKNGNFIGYTLGDVATETRQRNQYFLVPDGVDQVVVQCDSRLKINIDKATQAHQAASWKGKNILFLGTSIFATGTTFRDDYYTIPGYACHLLGANAIVQAKGESMARNGYEFAKSDSDPYGWTGAYWNNIAYSLSMTLEEKNELITNWESKWCDLLIGENKPQTLTDAIKTQWRGCSYENRLLPYLTGEQTKPDLIVIEHGRNDVAFFNQSADSFSGIPSVNPDELFDYNRSLYGDAMAFLIRIIREHLKHVPIMITGHFDNSGSFINLPTEQEKAAKYNGVYFCDTTPTGWNNCKVTVTGQFVDGYWVEDGVERVSCYRNANLADTIHPASTLSGEPIMIEAGIIANYIKSNIVP